MSDDEKQIYLFQNGKNTIEVELTGRTASRKKRRKTVVLHEIQSVDPDEGLRTWVSLDQLFVIDE